MVWEIKKLYGTDYVKSLKILAKSLKLGYIRYADVTGSLAGYNWF